MRIYRSRLQGALRAFAANWACGGLLSKSRRDIPDALQCEMLLRRSGTTLDGKFNPAPEPVDNYSPTQGFLEEFIRYDEFFGVRFNLLGCRKRD
jgi:hypothetical protein